MKRTFGLKMDFKLRLCGLTFLFDRDQLLVGTDLRSTSILAKRTYIPRYYSRYTHMYVHIPTT
jgi:hypothetical protein